MNNLIRNLNDGNKIGVMLVYGQNGSYVPVDMFYLSTTMHHVKNYDLKNNNVIYYNDDLFFTSKDNKLIIIDALNAVKLFKIYANIYHEFSLDDVNFEILNRYGSVSLSKYKPYSLDDLNAYYKSGISQMGRNYSLIPVVLKLAKDDNFAYDYDSVENVKREERYADFNMVRKLKKNYKKNGQNR